MREGFIWCPHCRQPHKLGDRFCASTGLPIEQRFHDALAPRFVAKHPLVGTVVGGEYEIVKRIGAGGIGEVFEARTRTSGARVAIKVVMQPSDERTERLRREAQLVGALKHPNICSVLDTGVTEYGQPYLVLEMLEGETLEVYMRRKRRLSPAAAIETFKQILSGLDLAHANGILHRDVKPANVFLVEQVGSAPLAKLLDFGFAKDVFSRDRRTLTLPGRTCGTPSYMSPEQLRAQRIDPRSDLFSVGIMLFEALTGQHPFAAATVAAVTIRIISEPAPRLRAVRRRLPQGLDDLIARVLDKSPDRRVRSAREMRDALTRINELDDATPTSTSAPRLGLPMLGGSSTSGSSD